MPATPINRSRLTISSNRDVLTIASIFFIAPYLRSDHSEGDALGLRRHSLDGVVAFLAGADADRLVDGADEDLAIADLARLRGGR